MNQEEIKVARLLMLDPGMVYFTLDGFRAYACAYGRLVLITGTNFNRMSRDEALAYVDATIQLHTINWPKAWKRAKHG